MLRTFAVLAAILASSPAFAQCCRGAQNAEALSKNSLYKVEAVSLTGTGFAKHGPYHYRFKWSEKNSRGFEEKSSFEVKSDSTAHFSVGIWISPAGNGFLLDLSPAPKITFHGTTGHPIRSYTRKELRVAWRDRDDDPLFLKLWDPEPVPVPGMPGASNYVEGGALFLPFGAPVSDALESRILTLLNPDSKDRKAVEDLLETLETVDPEIREKMTEELIRKGTAGLDLIEKAAASGSADVRDRASYVLLQLQSRTAGFRDPRNNVRLMAALLRYPSAKVATIASERLTALLPKAALERARTETKSAQFQETTDWILSHAPELRWDAATSKYVWDGE